MEFEIRDGLAPYEVHKELLLPLEAAGAAQVAKAGPLEAMLAFPGLIDGEAWAASFAVDGVADGVRVRLRLRPQTVTEFTFWPPERLRAPLRALLTARACFVGDQRIPIAATDVSVDQVDAFVRDVLRNKNRTLPVVILTPGPWGTPESAQRLAEDLVGVAAVYRFATAGATFELSALVGGKERSVYGGAVRIYRPGFDPSDDPLDHDLLIPRYLETRLLGGRPLAAELARRILPMAGEPISLPSAARPQPVPATADPVANKSAPAHR